MWNGLYAIDFPQDDWTPLDDYVWRDVEDDPYMYDVHAEYTGDGYVMYVLNMTSQRWMNGGFINLKVFFYYTLYTQKHVISIM